MIFTEVSFWLLLLILLAMLGEVVDNPTRSVPPASSSKGKNLISANLTSLNLAGEKFRRCGKCSLVGIESDRGEGEVERERVKSERLDCKVREKKMKVRRAKTKVTGKCEQY